MSAALHLIPVAIAEGDPKFWLPAEAIEQSRLITHWIVENAKPARAHIGRIKPATPIQQHVLHEINSTTAVEQIDTWLQPIRQGVPVGLISDAGCPAVADPGARVVARAHALGLTVMPWVGPSSILLALMGSGLEGQRFRFHGYLAADESGRREQLRAMEHDSATAAQTELWIETPYRNANMWSSCLQMLHPETRLGFAQDLTGPSQRIGVQRVEQWRAGPQSAGPDSRVPTVFMLLANPARTSARPEAQTERLATPKQPLGGVRAARRRNPAR